jgi:hypothetical protein
LGGGGGSDGGSVGFGGGGGDGGGYGGFGGGDSGGGAGMGGAIFNMGADSAHPGSGQATLVNCTLTANTAQGGHAGSFSGETGGSGYGGAVFNLDGQVVLLNDTLAANSVIRGAGDDRGDAFGGAVYNRASGSDIESGNPVTASLVLNNSILANSIGGVYDLISEPGPGNGPDTATVSGSHNLVMSSSGSIGAGVITLTANPDLGPLQNNGGLTPTMLPLPGSPILGAGAPSLAPSSDQRGVSRPPGGPTDLGSVQVSVAPLGGGTPISAGFFGLAIEEFELTVDSVLALIEGALQMPHASLDAAIDQLHTAIANDPLTPTFAGQLAILLGESAALNALSRG